MNIIPLKFIFDRLTLFWSKFNYYSGITFTTAYLRFFAPQENETGKLLFMTFHLLALY